MGIGKSPLNFQELILLPLVLLFLAFSQCQSEAGHVVGSDEPHPIDQFCYPKAKAPFYQRDYDGAICCRGKELPVVTITPEIAGECQIYTNTSKDGLLNSDPLWCSYTCSLKKLGAIDSQGKTVPEKFLNHLSKDLSKASRDRVKTIMDKYLGCWKPMKNSKNACLTPLSFHKCYQDALVFLCTFVTVPKNGDFSAYKKVKGDYDKLEGHCYFNNRKIMPGCCHGKPLPWTVTELMELASPKNESGYQACVTEMGNECEATCLLKSMNVLTNDFDMDLDKFEAKLLKLFPFVKASEWMNSLAPVFLFYNEVLEDMGDGDYNPTQRACRFFDRVMELHESKVDQYCAMTSEELKSLGAN